MDMQFQKIFIPPPTEGQRKFQGGGGWQKQVLNEKYGDKNNLLEFLVGEGWGSQTKNLLYGGL